MDWGAVGPHQRGGDLGRSDAWSISKVLGVAEVRRSEGDRGALVEGGGSTGYNGQEPKPDLVSLVLNLKELERESAEGRCDQNVRMA